MESKNENDPKEESVNMDSLMEEADRYFEDKSFDKSIKTYLKALERAEKSHGLDSFEVGDALSRMCVVYAAMESVYEAISTAERAIIVLGKKTTVNSELKCAICCYIIGRCYVKTKDCAKAISYLNFAVKIWEKYKEDPTVNITRLRVLIYIERCKNLLK
jgi:tetratricopeptide (TPR) repeat protein